MYIHHLRLYTHITLVYHPTKVNYQAHSFAYTCIFIISDCTHILLWYTIPLRLITRCIVLHIHVYSSSQTVHTYYSGMLEYHMHIRIPLHYVSFVFIYLVSCASVAFIIFRTTVYTNRVSRRIIIHGEPFNTCMYVRILNVCRLLKSIQYYFGRCDQSKAL